MSARRLLGLGLALLGAGCGNKVSPLDRPILPQLVAESGPTDLLSVCREVDMPCGWELVPSEASKHVEAVQNLREAGTARRMLDNLVERRPVYRWFLAMDDTVINIAPKKIGANDPLDRQVWVDFKDAPAERALKELLDSAGLKLVAPPAPREEVYGESTRPGLFTLKAQGLRLRIALNRLVAAEGRSLWWCAQTPDPDALRCALLGWRRAPVPRLEPAP
jgi:hypothetical protein